MAAFRLGKPSGWDVISLAAVLVLGAFVALDRARLPEAERMEATLESELQSIAPPSGARMIGDISRLVKGTGVVVSKRYQVSDGLSTTSHFRQQLAGHGWSPCTPGASTLCKGAFHAAVESEAATSGAEVTVVLSWQ